MAMFRWTMMDITWNGMELKTGHIWWSIQENDSVLVIIPHRITSAEAQDSHSRRIQVQVLGGTRQ